MDLDKFNELPIIGILRGIESDVIEPLTQTLISSGLKSVEIAMNTKDADKLIGQMIKTAKGGLMIGAGTVLSMSDLEKALSAGASFIVMPALIDDVVKYCVKKKIPVFPGALTPQEILRAWQAGATMVKVFPAKLFGPSYFKELKGPFQDIKLLACGGITPENIRVFFKSGASAIAFGASIFKKEWLKNRDFSQIENSIKKLISSYQKTSK